MILISLHFMTYQLGTVGMTHCRKTVIGYIGTYIGRIKNLANQMNLQ